MPASQQWITGDKKMSESVLIPEVLLPAYRIENGLEDGARFGALAIIGWINMGPPWGSLCNVQCECGERFPVNPRRLLDGSATSCEWIATRDAIYAAEQDEE